MTLMAQNAINSIPRKPEDGLFQTAAPDLIPRTAAVPAAAAWREKTVKNSIFIRLSRAASGDTRGPLMEIVPVVAHFRFFSPKGGEGWGEGAIYIQLKSPHP